MNCCVGRKRVCEIRVDEWQEIMKERRENRGCDVHYFVPLPAIQINSELYSFIVVWCSEVRCGVVWYG